MSDRQATMTRGVPRWPIRDRIRRERRPSGSLPGSVRLVHLSRPMGAKPLRMLVVDDDAEVLTSLAIVLRLEGHVVACAPSGRAALEQLTSDTTLDVVLTDLGMPDVNGWVVARTAKERWPNIVVGLITGWRRGPVGTEQERATVDFILAKPVDRRTLADALERVRQRSDAA